MLTPSHAAALSASSISPQVVAERGYYTAITKAEIGRLGFGDFQRNVPALVVPIHDVAGAVSMHVIRPDAPRMNPKTGKPTKYEFRHRSRMCLDVPPSARVRLANPTIPLWVTEGSKKADAAVSHGLCCVSIIGVWNWRGTNGMGGKTAMADWESIALNDREVYVAFDSDVMLKKSVSLALSRLKPFLESRKAHVRLVYLPPLPDGAKMGLDDFFATGRGVEDLLALAVKELRKPTEPKERATGERPEIVISTEISQVVNAAESALLASPGLELYQRGGELVRIVRGASGNRSGLKRDPTAPLIGIVPEAHLTELCARSAAWLKTVPVSEKDGGGTENVPALPPRWAVQALAARGSWRFRSLDAIIETPCIRPDGSVLSAPGYDEATGIMFEPTPGTPPFPEISENPSSTEAHQALAYINDIIDGFPFLEPSDRAAAIASILTPIARPALGGPAPLFAIRAPAAGTGKSILANVAAVVATGRRAALMTQSSDPGEESKRILSIGLEGDRVVLIDNVERPLGSAALSLALTGTTFRERLLGSNKMATVPMHATWFATGNNLVFKGDLGRRVVPIDLDAKVERPETRSGFKYAKLLDHVVEVRPTLVAACLTILRAFLVRDTEPVELSAFGSFEGWSDLVRHSLVWLGMADPCAGRERIRADSDPELTTLREALEVWLEVLGEEYHTVAEVLLVAKLPTRSYGVGSTTILSPTESDGVRLRAALAPLDSKSDGERIDPKRLGWGLRKHKDRIVNGMRVEGSTDGKKGVRWRVRKV